MTEESIDQVEVEVAQSGDQDFAATIAELTKQITEEKDRALRSRAELENFRKRKEAEVDAFRQYANEKLIVEFLPILDSFDRAMESLNDPNAAALVEGVLLIQKQFVTTMEKLGVTGFESLNQQFDPAFHMAVSEEAAEGVAPGTVVKEFQRGYKLQDRVIRPAMVVVAK
ncbi:nucleotide exchange factor GrpE [bacterium]|nr:nucleotide exchange factor GrpE [bacterium]